MSPHWRDRLTVLLAPEQVGVRCHAAVWRRAPLGDFSLRCEGEGPHAVVGTLRAALARVAAAAPLRRWQPRPAVRLLLSHRLAPLTLVAQARQLQGAEEREAAARHGFAAVYGDEALAWQVVVDRRAQGDTALAAGLPGALIERLRQAVADAGLQLGAVEPMFSEASREASRAAAAWLVLTEPGRVLLARQERGRWRSLRTHRPRQPLAGELVRWIEQARLIDGVDGPDAIVVAGSSRHELASFTKSGWTCAHTPALDMP